MTTDRDTLSPEAMTDRHWRDLVLIANAGAMPTNRDVALAIAGDLAADELARRAASAPKHRIVTVERGDGYAARCEYDQDGATHLCAITFGGFPSRSAARSACQASHDMEVAQ